MAQSVKGKTAIVTGAGSGKSQVPKSLTIYSNDNGKYKGINLCFVRLLLQNGCNCLLADLALRPEAQATVDQYSISSPRAIFQQTDVTEWSQLDRMFEVAEKEFGQVDIVCPGAGVFEPPSSSFWYPPGSPESRDSPFGSRYSALDINLTHPIRTTQLAISRFANSKTPKSIVHISSIAGQGTTLLTPIYSATKHAINGFVRSLAKLDQIGIRVTAVAPGFIKTPLWTEHLDKMKTLDESKDVWVTPEEVAEVMLALVERDQVNEMMLSDSKEAGRIIKIGAGTILEVSKTVRAVSAFNDSGPLGRAGNSMLSPEETEEEFLRLVQSRSWGKP
ncbi:3-hydroxybutyrate dehydrogenase [[Emmonsia] crescens]|uniref:3-hydroxybutyrate dehydrogenase n=1 Tax=[Emmonsia] crescens TaxID=73230 RepID=A0A0G2HNY4_9EURO|nr:3-hydroxybutyrate dehydrogenase [Emmonsia crescens UAMH 3008]